MSSRLVSYIDILRSGPGSIPTTTSSPSISVMPEPVIRGEFSSSKAESGDMNVEHATFFSDSVPPSGFVVGEDDEDGEVDNDDSGRVGEGENDDQDKKISTLDDADSSMPSNLGERADFGVMKGHDDSQDDFMSDDIAEEILTKLQEDASVQGIQRN